MGFRVEVKESEREGKEGRLDPVGGEGQEGEVAADSPGNSLVHNGWFIKPSSYLITEHEHAPRSIVPVSHSESPIDED